MPPGLNFYSTLNKGPPKNVEHIKILIICRVIKNTEISAQVRYSLLNFILTCKMLFCCLPSSLLFSVDVGNKTAEPLVFPQSYLSQPLLPIFLPVSIFSYPVSHSLSVSALTFSISTSSVFSTSVSAKFPAIFLVV